MPRSPRARDTIIRKALEKNPDVRYQTARDLFNDLQRVRGELDEVERHGTTIRRSSGSHLHAARRSAPKTRSRSITFTNITREPADEWIGSGIAETVSADLKNVQGLTVIGRERVFDALRNLERRRRPQDDRFAIEIGRGLGARWIVSGAYQRLGESIRITARFVEVATGAVLRNVKIDGRLSDIFGLQDRIVFELTQDLRLQARRLRRSTRFSSRKRDRSRRTSSSRAACMTLRMASRDAPDRAISLFERRWPSTRITPRRGPAWAARYQIQGDVPQHARAAREGPRASSDARWRWTRLLPSANVARR